MNSLTSGRQEGTAQLRRALGNDRCIGRRETLGGVPQRQCIASLDSPTQDSHMCCRSLDEYLDEAD